MQLVLRTGSGLEGFMREQDSNKIQRNVCPVLYGMPELGVALFVLARSFLTDVRRGLCSTVATEEPCSGRNYLYTRACGRKPQVGHYYTTLIVAPVLAVAVLMEIY